MKCISRLWRGKKSAPSNWQARRTSLRSDHRAVVMKKKFLVAFNRGRLSAPLFGLENFESKWMRFYYKSFVVSLCITGLPSFPIKELCDRASIITHDSSFCCDFWWNQSTASDDLLYNHVTWREPFCSVCFRIDQLKTNLCESGGLLTFESVKWNLRERCRPEKLSKLYLSIKRVTFSPRFECHWLRNNNFDPDASVIISLHRRLHFNQTNEFWETCLFSTCARLISDIKWQQDIRRVSE